jgi:hypothetical protein
MRKRMALAFAVVAVATGCFKTQLSVPHGQHVELLSLDAPVTVTREYKNWYVLWGAVPIFETTPAEVVEEEKLRQVRVKTTDTFVDAVIAFFLGELSILPQTVTVEGNR